LPLLDEVMYLNALNSKLSLHTFLSSASGAELVDVTDPLGTGRAFVLSANVATLVAATTGNDSITGTTGADTLDGLAGADTLVGLAGNDTYVVDNAGDKTIEAASGGTDTVKASLSWTLATEVENLVLTGTGNFSGKGNASANSLAGNSGNNLLDGSSGNDTLLGNGGADSLFGGTGNDSLSGGDGNDIIGYDSESGAFHWNSPYSAINWNVPYDDEAGNDTLLGGAGDDSLGGGSGSDSLDGGDGNDYLVDFGSSTDTLVGGAGTDTVELDLSDVDTALNVTFNPAATQTLSGKTISGFEQIWIWGGNGNDSLNGGSGNDMVGDDDGSLGADTLVGGAGSDGLGLLWQYEYESVNFTFNPAATQTLQGNTFSGFEFLYAVMGTGNDTVVGATGDDTFDGGYGNDSLIGGAGNDLFSISESDMFSGEGNDTLNGGDGNDTLVGGADSDVLIGGAGSDQFVFATLGDGGVDRVRDFVSGTDKIVIGSDQYGGNDYYFSVGDNDDVIDGAVTISAPGGFSTSVELVVMTTNIRGGSVTDPWTVASKLGSATGNYAYGQSAIFVVDDGSNSAVYYFQSNDGNAQINGSELTLLAALQGTHATTVSDYIFGG
jgi:Ca2+-binding RTX toxin-like protein